MCAAGTVFSAQERSEARRRAFPCMIPYWQWLVERVTSRLWFRSALLAALGIVTAMTAYFFRGFIPDDFPAKVGADAVDGILNILASSMLTVTTFSLSVMIVAFGRSTQNATPRATRLLAEDRTAQNVLSTFIGAFLFALVGLVALSAGVYGGSGRIILFAATILVIVAIVVALVSWIDHLTRFGQVDETASRVEKATARALQRHAERPCLGGRPFDPETLSGRPHAIWSEKVGYVLYIDIEQLANIAEKSALDIYLMVTPGAFVHYQTALVRFSGQLDDRQLEKLRSALTIGDVRSFDQDPMFGLTVLSEIASRALSPGINDPGTAIDVIGRIERLLLDYLKERGEAKDEGAFRRLWVPPLSLADVFDVAFNPIARDGARMAEVQHRLQQAFTSLAASGDPEFVANAARQSAIALQRAEEADLAGHEIAVVRRTALANAG